MAVVNVRVIHILKALKYICFECIYMIITNRKLYVRTLHETFSNLFYDLNNKIKYNLLCV